MKPKRRELGPVGRKPRWLLVGTTLVLALAATARGAEPLEPEIFEQAVIPFFDAHCLGCHDEVMQKGRFRVDTLGPGFTERGNAARWQKVFDKVASGG